MVFAYGSNMDARQTAERCPGARRVGAATLPRHRLTFGGWSDSWGGAVATVARARGAQVPGVVYEVPYPDLLALDRFEGVPFQYDRRWARVTLGQGRGPIHAYVYELVDPEPALPSRGYLERIARAYAILGFRTAPLFEALRALGPLLILRQNGAGLAKDQGGRNAWLRPGRRTSERCGKRRGGS
jgi:gamma-glutamylcyclotransferase (GGCT)/AIG2-like uncharacterized protein YtfP